VSGGEQFLITASGSINCCSNGPTFNTGPNGYPTNPFGTSNVITNSAGTPIGSYSDPLNNHVFALLGLFVGEPGTPSPFVIGTSALVTAPAGATQLYFGVADAQDMTGPSGFYVDNSGSFTVNISAVPEPSTWAMMIVGFAGMGLLAYRRNRKSGPVAV
jgi:hypothetical protein